MNPQRLILTICTVVLGLGFMLTGCGNFLKPEQGAVAREEARISLAKDIPTGGTWQRGDLCLDYGFVSKGELLELTGQVIFSQSLTASFPAVTKFFLYISFLDDGGKVIETVNISPVINTFGLVPESLDIRMSHKRPPGAAAVVFHWYGVFRGDFKDSASSWDIYHFPFD